MGELGLYRGLQIVAVAAAHGKGQGQATLESPAEHPAVTGFQAIVAELEAAQSIALMRIGTGQVQHKTRIKAVFHLLQGKFQGLQVGIVGTAIRQVHIQITGHLAEGKVLFAMQ